MTRVLDDPVPATRVRRRPEPVTIVTGVALVATIGILMSLALTRSTPVFFGDEIGYLANSLALAGGPSMHLDAGAYYFGWSVVLAPLWWLTTDPLQVYRGAAVLSGLSAVATIFVLAGLGTRLGLDRRHALIAGCIAVALPGRMLMSQFALAENFLGLVVAAAVLAAFRASASTRLAWWPTLGALSGAAFSVHERAAPLVAVSVLWAVWLVVRRSTVAGLLLGASSLVVAGAGYGLARHFGAAIYLAKDRESLGLSRLFTSDPADVALAGSGQIWFAVAATSGLVVLGIVALAPLVGRELKGRRPGPATWLAAGTSGLAVVSFTYLSVAVGADERLDMFVYGRYLEPVVDVVAFFGVVLLVRGLSQRRAVLVIALVAATSIAYLAVDRALVPPGGRATYASNVMNVLGLAHLWRSPGSAGPVEQIPVASASSLALAVLVVVLLLRVVRARPTAALGVLLGWFLTASLVGQALTVTPAYALWSDAFRLAPIVDTLPGTSISYDLQPDTANGTPAAAVSRNAYQFFLAPRSVPVVDSSTGRLPTTTLVIARRAWVTGYGAGWRKIADDRRYDDALWVRPGSLQDRLGREGRLDGRLDG